MQDPGKQKAKDHKNPSRRGPHLPSTLGPTYQVAIKENQAGDQRRRSAQEEEKEDGAVRAFLSLAAITHGRAAQSTCVLITELSS